MEHNDRISASERDHHENWFGNHKRLFDEFLAESLETQRMNRRLSEKFLADAEQFDNARQNISNQALQNAVETANMVGKQAVRHAEIAIDNQWNPVQQGAGDAITARAVTLDDVALKAIGAAVAAAIADAMKK